MTKLHHIEQRTQEWSEIRMGKITGSNFKNIINPSGKIKKDRNGNLGKTAMSNIYTAVAEQMTGFSQEKDLSYIEAVQHGIEFEDEAKEQFFNHMGWQQKSPWQNIGFITVGWLEHLGISPDYICGDDPKEALETKCPTSPKHIEIIHTRKIPDEWIPQAIGYFVFMENLNLLHWVSYDFRVKNKPLMHFKIYRKEWEDRIKAATDAFIEVDEIITNLLK